MSANKTFTQDKVSKMKKKWLFWSYKKTMNARAQPWRENEEI